MTSAIIVAAGKGTRMASNVDKTFLDLHGRPVLAHTWQTFDHCPEIQEIVLVVREETRDACARLADQFRFHKPFRLILGGKERQDSVGNGLAALSEKCEIVCIQDAARPCTAQSLILATIEAAREAGAAVAAQPVTDTIKESADGEFIDRTIDRSKLFSVQTPQTFRVEVIRHALREVKKRGLLVTDDTAACELIGQRVKLVLSALPNPKVTRPDDLPFVEHLLAASARS